LSDRGNSSKFFRMKKINLIIVSILFFGSSLSLAQTNKIPADLSLAFKTGNVEKLSEYLNSTVELVILDKEDFYNKKVARSILKEFFAEHQVVEFVIKHQGGPNDANFAIGDLRTKDGSFRVYFLMKKVDSKPLIHQLRIEKDDPGSN
jgi:hypothetical protein